MSMSGAVIQLPAAIHALDLFGTAVFALTGALRALTKKLDLMGAVVLAIVTAMGGGMMRDALIGRHPPAAFADQTYLLIAIIVGILAFFWGRHLHEQENWLITFDAIGLGVFTLVGATVADQAGLGPVGVIFIAMLTSTGGGALRAMLVAEIPFILMLGRPLHIVHGLHRRGVCRRTGRCQWHQRNTGDHHNAQRHHQGEKFPHGRQQ